MIIELGKSINLVWRAGRKALSRSVIVRRPLILRHVACCCRSRLRDTRASTRAVYAEVLRSLAQAAPPAGAQLGFGSDPRGKSSMFDLAATACYMRCEGGLSWQ